MNVNIKSLIESEESDKELFVNKEGEKEGREYNPRPLYRRFDD